MTNCGLPADLNVSAQACDQMKCCMGLFIVVPMEFQALVNASSLVCIRTSVLLLTIEKSELIFKLPAALKGQEIIKGAPPQAII
jgi:hypothetical protein